MASVDATIDIDRPSSLVYDRWTRFEEFPRFMEGVEEVERRNESTMRWTAQIGGKTKEWEAQITDQVPGQRIAWTSTGGTPNGGKVSFQALPGDQTRIHLEIEYDPEGLVEQAGDALGFMSRRVEGDLKRFKETIEGDRSPS